MALFSNSRTLEWADVSVGKVHETKMAWLYLNSFLDARTTLKLTRIQIPSLRFFFHRSPTMCSVSASPGCLQAVSCPLELLVHQSTGGSKPELPPRGQELAELKAPSGNDTAQRQQELGYMYLDGAGEYFRPDLEGRNPRGTGGTVWDGFTCSPLVDAEPQRRSIAFRWASHISANVGGAGNEK